MKVGIASDHAGFAMKQELIAYLQGKGHEVLDCGTYSEESTDYAIWGEKLARAVACGEAERGIAVCGTGIGIGISCNKVNGIRAGIVSDTVSTELTRRHNDANIVAFGARIIGIVVAEEIIDVFLNTPFEGGRHQRRIDQIADIEKRNRG